MKLLRLAQLSILGLVSITLNNCQSDDLDLGKELVLDLPPTPYSYNLPLDNRIPTLGRVLFYDTRLSTNNSVSCSSCHKQQLAFADRVNFSLGFENRLTSRNSMPIQNIVSNSLFGNGFIDSVIFSQPKIDPGSSVIEPIFFPGSSTALFWDGRQHNLETMVMEPIKNHIEMGTTSLDGLASKLAQIPEYETLFYEAFGPIVITPENIAKALSAFLVSIRSDQSKFDLSMRGVGQLSALEMLGRDLFFNKYDCNSCHQLQTPFNGYQFAGPGLFGGFANIGLDEHPTDPGLRKVTDNPDDEGKFKIPSLRNIALTAPYMHDGRLKTLDDVLNHYSENIKETENLDHRLRTPEGSAKQFKIPASEKQAIIAFLNSLTDYQMISDPKYSNPFKLQ